MKSHQKFDVRIGWTSVGKGVFAEKDYHVNWVIGEILGDLINDPDYGSDYCIETQNGYSLEPYPPFRFLNHSCEPNCEFEWFDMEEDGNNQSTQRLFLNAQKEIMVGEELTINYNWPAGEAIRCFCKAQRCRGWIVFPS